MSFRIYEESFKNAPIFSYNIPYRLKCPICHKMLDKPSYLPCGCRFCYNCIVDYIKNGNKTCLCYSESKICLNMITKKSNTDISFGDLIVICNEDIYKEINMSELVKHIMDCELIATTDSNTDGFEMDEIESNTEDFEAMMQEIKIKNNELETRLNKSENEILQLQNENMEINNQIKILIETQQKMMESWEILSNEKLTLDENILVLLKMNQTLELKLYELNNTKEGLELKIVEMAECNESLKDDVKKLVNTRNSLVKSNEKMVSERNTIMESNQKLVSERNTIMESNQKLVSERNTIMESNQKLVSENYDLQIWIEKLWEEIKEMKLKVNLNDWTAANSTTNEIVANSETITKEIISDSINNLEVTISAVSDEEMKLLPQRKFKIVNISKLVEFEDRILWSPEWKIDGSKSIEIGIQIKWCELWLHIFCVCETKVDVAYNYDRCDSNGSLDNNNKPTQYRKQLIISIINQVNDYQITSIEFDKKLLTNGSKFSQKCNKSWRKISNSFSTTSGDVMILKCQW